MTRGARPAPAEAPLLERIAAALAAAGVRYCQWKGHWKRARWMAGEGDVDLLVERAAWARFVATLKGLGLKRSLPPARDRIPGVESFWGYDETARTLFHVHAATRLVISDTVGKVFRVPIERPLFAGRLGRGTFPTPPAAFELVTFVLRTALRHSWRDRGPGGLGGWLEMARDELKYLERRAPASEVQRVLSVHLPWIDPAVFAACRAALEPGSPLRTRLRARRALARGMEGGIRRPTPWVRARRAARWVLRRLGAPEPAADARLAGGGAVIALSGPDGSGKSTCAQALAAWLWPHFHVMTAHLGRPPRSLLTLVVGALARLLPAPWLRWLRLVCTARDRYRLAARTWRFALDGGIAITERYPLEPSRPLVGARIRDLTGPRTRGPARWLADVEERYYRCLPVPDQILVLTVEPDVAVRRKTDEPPDYVRARAETMQRADWSATPARLVDAGRPLPDVIADLKALVWREL
jgi:thymidylate kinase